MPPLLPSTESPIPSRWRWFTAPARAAAAVFLFVASLGLIAWLTLHWGILPRLNDWRPQIEARLGASLGVPVRIGAIHVRSGGWVPAFEVDDVRLLDVDGQVALRLGRVSAALSPASLWALQPRFAQLHFDGVQLDARRDTQGRLFLAGIALGGGEAAEPGALNWVFEQHEIVIRAGTLRWTDELRGAPPLQLSDVDLVLRNDRRRHAMRFDATPPADWGQRLALRARFTQPLTAAAGDWRRWRGEVYADLPLADVSQLRRYLDLPFTLDDGRGALRAWLDVDRGRLMQGTADVALASVSLRLGPDLPALALQRLQGRVLATRRVDGVDLRLDGLSFRGDDGVPWEPTSARLTLDQSADGSMTAGTLRVDRLDLAPAARLLARLPLPPSLHETLASLAPQGQVNDLALGWRGPPTAPRSYTVNARAQGLSLAAGPPGPPADGRSQTAGRPGLRNAGLTVDASEAGGQATLSIDGGALVLPGVLVQPELPLKKLAASLSWQVQPGQEGAPPALSLTLRHAELANADVQGSLSGSWKTGPGEGFGAGKRFPGQIVLDARIDGGDAARVARYLPLGVHESARGYVERAVGPGRIEQGSAELRGDLWHFPYADGSPGTFRIRVRAQDLRLAYIPSEPGWISPWPVMTAISGELEFDRGAMRIAHAQGNLGGIALRDVGGGIEDLAGTSVLKLQGSARGAAADLLNFVGTSPVGGWMGGALHGATASGVAELALALTVPLQQPERSQVRGSVQLTGNDLRLQPGMPLLAQARGRVDFTEQGVKVDGGRALALGGDVGIEGGTQPDGSLRFIAQGTATANALAQARDVDALAPLVALHPYLGGQAAYRLELDFNGKAPGVSLISDLVGLSLGLPEPMRKPAAASWPLRLRMSRVPGHADIEALRIELGTQLQARYERDVSGAQAHVLRGAIGIGEPAPKLPDAGVIARVTVPRLDLDAWRALAGQDDAVAGAAPPEAWPTQGVLRAGELILAGRRVAGVSLQLQQQVQPADTVWVGQLSAAQAEGRIELRLPNDGRSPGRVTARLARLEVPEPDGSAVDKMFESAPEAVPALDLVIDDFHWGGKALGRVEVEAVNRAVAGQRGGREWQLDRLQVSAPDSRLTGSGRWSPGRRMDLDFTLELLDGGRFAERMGAGSGLAGGKGSIVGTLSWAGSPLTPDTASLDGQLHIDLAEGRFLNAEPGAARLLGVLSLQALPRRLLLDFRDVFQDGFAFDTARGAVHVNQGMASTDNLRLVGVQAAVLIEGQADLRAETQDLRVVVVPEINAAAASLAYAAINPAIGLATFVAQWLLREPMMAASTREFTVTGGWTDPKVERVARVAPEPPAASAVERR